MLDAIRQVADTVAEDRWSEAQWDTGKSLKSCSLCTVVGNVSAARNPCLMIAHKKVVTMDLLGGIFGF